MLDIANRRQIVVDFLGNHPVEIHIRTDGATRTVEMAPPFDQYDISESGIDVSGDGIVAWDDISTICERPAHLDHAPRTIAFTTPALPAFESAFIADLMEDSDVRTVVDLLLLSNPGRLADGVAEASAAMSATARTGLADAILAGLNHPDFTLVNLLLGIGLFGEPHHVLGFGDYLLQPTDGESETLYAGRLSSHGWRVPFVLAALRLAGTRDAYMQIQRACYESPRPVVLDHAREVLLRVAGDQKKPFWAVEDDLVPDCGLDRDRDATVVWQGEALEMRLDDELRPFLCDAEGRRMELPDEKAASVSDPAVHHWNVVTEQVTEAIPVQARRLEESLTQQHRWEHDEWMQRVVRHPLLIHLAQRVIWGTYSRSGRRLTGTFRVAPDRTLWGPDDELLELDDPAGIGLVHPLELDEPTRAAWNEILADYEVVTLFPQIDRPTYAPSDEERRSDVVTLGFEAPADSLVYLHQRGWQRQSGWGYWLVRPFRHREVRARLHCQERDDGSIAYEAVEFERYLSYPQMRFELRDVADVPYSETLYELETLRMPQETGGWPAVVSPSKS